MNRLKTLLFAVPLIITAFLALARAETCNTGNCTMPGPGAEQKPVVVQSNYPKLAPAQGIQYPSASGQPGKTMPVATPPPPAPTTVARPETTTPRQTKVSKNDDIKPQILIGGFDDVLASRDDQATIPDLPQRITPEGPSQVVLSSSDINRIICPVDIKDAIYSKEKGLTVRLAGQNAFVKFLVMKKDGKDLYATTPSELYVVCGENVYTMIAVPRRIPAQTVQLSGGKAEANKLPRRKQRGIRKALTACLHVIVDNCRLAV